MLNVKDTLYISAVFMTALISFPLSLQAQETPASGAAINMIMERIDGIDEQLRTLRGEIEKVDFDRRNDMEQLIEIVGDLDNNLSALEADINKTSQNSTETQQAQQQANPPAPIANRADEIVPTDNGRSQSSVQTLGTLSADGTAQSGTPEGIYEAAFTLLKQSQYAEAETAFKEFLSQHPNHSLVGNAQYWLGETYYAREDFTQAAKAFAKGYQDHRDAPKAADNLLKLGLSLQSLGSKEDACVTYAQLEKDFPDAPDSILDRASQEMERLACNV